MGRSYEMVIYSRHKIDQVNDLLNATVGSQGGQSHIWEVPLPLSPLNLQVAT